MEQNKTAVTQQPQTSNGVALIERKVMTLQEIVDTGKTFIESKMFADVQSVAQAVVKIMAGQELGIAPFASMSGIHIIKGKPTVGAAIMASRVKASGKYDYKVIKLTDDECSIEFYEGSKLLGNSRFTSEHAKKAFTQNMDKFGRNMLFARAVSNGVKWFCPDVFEQAVYTPEEMESVQVEDAKSEVVKETKKVSAHEPEPTHTVTVVEAVNLTTEDKAAYGKSQVKETNTNELPL